MITAQDIHEKTFATVRINGYDKPSVDDFLDELAEEIAAAQKENTVLKSKMKVLVDKIEEYRSNEEALNMAVISAQKLAVQIESEARSRASAILADAEAQAQAKIGGIAAQVESEEKRLSDAKVVTAAFLKKAKELVGSELKALETIGTKLEVKDSMAPAPKAAAPAPAPAPAPTPAPAPAPAAAPAEPSIEDAVRAIEDNVSKLRTEPEMDLDFQLDLDGVKPSKSKRSDSTQPFSL